MFNFYSNNDVYNDARNDVWNDAWNDVWNYFQKRRSSSLFAAASTTLTRVIKDEPFSPRETDVNVVDVDDDKGLMPKNFFCQKPC